MVFYRKYRPQTIEELDSTGVRQTLTAVLSKNVPHALLFTGPKGLGKTSTARIVAKVVNCTGREQTTDNKQQTTKKDKLSVDSRQLNVSIEPCNECEQCVSITNGTNMDVIEMDAASNRGIDEVRELKETIKLSPLAAQRKIYIIDEVHMLTTEAFNALLKTLEEPPEHAMFILCTTELHKVPSTIISRCYHVSFKSATTDELIRSFKRIVKGEKLNIDDQSLNYIAELSGGGFRDGAKILEELSSLASGEKITQKLIEEKYNLTGIEKIKEDIVTSFLTKDIKKGMSAFQEADRMGMDARYLFDEIFKEFHNVLLLKAGVESNDSSRKNLEISTEDLLKIVELLTKAAGEMKFSVLPQVPLELAFMQWSFSERQDEAVVEHNFQNDTVNIPSLRKKVGNLSKESVIKGDKKTSQPKQENAVSRVSILHFSASGDITKEYLAEFWGALLDNLKKEHHTTAGVLRGCVIKSFDRKELIIQTSYKFHKERLDEAKTKQIIESVCKDLTGNPVTVTVELKSQQRA